MSTSRSELLRWWGWLLVVSIAFELLVAARYFSDVSFDRAPDAIAFRVLMLIAHFTTLAAVVLSPALAAIMLRAPSSVVLILGTGLSVAASLVLLIDTQVYQLYRFHINAGVMSLLLGGAARETFEFSGAMYGRATAVGLGLVFVHALAAWMCWRYVRRNQGRPLTARLVAALLVASVISFHGIHVWADVVARESLLEQTDALPMRYAATAKRFMRGLGFEVRSRPALANDRAANQSALAYPLQAIECTRASKPPNILVILIDSWRFDALNAQVTPNLDQFARRSVRFMDHHSGGNATRIGVFSLFYSIPGTYWHRVLAERQGPVFISELLRQGYDVDVFRSAPLFSPEFDRTVFADVGVTRLRSDGKDAAARDRDATEDFVTFARSRRDDRPFFALLFFDAPHKLITPANYPKVFQPSAADIDYLSLDPSTDPLPLMNRYRNSVHYVDSLIGEVIDEVETRGLLDNTIIVITGDHGQEFNDNRLSYWGHGSNFTRYQTGVPFVLYAPRLSPSVHTHRTTHFDVVPTLMRDYLGCSEPFANYSVGHSLFEAGGRETMLLSEYTDFAIVTADRIAVVRKQGLQVLDPSYAEVADDDLAPGVIGSALEQKSRFYRKGLAASP